MKITEKDIGRRVVVNGEYDNEIFDKEYGCFRCFGPITHRPGVEFDKSRAGFHNLDGSLKLSHGWYVTEDMITFTDEENKTDMDFQVGDKVQCLIHGDGVVERIDNDELPIVVNFTNDGSQESYTKEGRYFDHNFSNQVLYHAGSIKREGGKIIIDPVKPVREKWVNVYLDSDGKPYFGDCHYDTEESAKEGVSYKGYITTIQLKRSGK